MRVRITTSSVHSCHYGYVITYRPNTLTLVVIRGRMLDLLRVLVLEWCGN